MDFEKLLRQARERELLTVQEREDRHYGAVRWMDEEEARAEEKAEIVLQRVWSDVKPRMMIADPEGDTLIVDDRCKDKIPARPVPARFPFPRWSQSEQRLMVARDAKIKELAYPAWDMMATLQLEELGDTYELKEYPLYLGYNGTIYCGPKDPTANGVYTDWTASYRSAGDIPTEWYPRSLSAEPVNNREEVAAGLANLIVKHELSFHLPD